jgi:transcriptional regulator with XRE-family HTH domain
MNLSDSHHLAAPVARHAGRLTPAEAQAIFADRFGQYLDTAGVARGYGRIAKVMELLGISQPTAARWVHGNAIPDPLTLLKIAAKAMKPVGWFLGEEPPGAMAYRPSDPYELGSLPLAMSEAMRVRLSSQPFLDPRWLAVQSAVFRPLWSPGDFVVYSPSLSLPVDSDFMILNTRQGLALRYVEVHQDGYVERGALTDRGLWIPAADAQDKLQIAGRVMYKVTPGADAMPAAQEPPRTSSSQTA